jgi:hypothetical protein
VAIAASLTASPRVVLGTVGPPATVGPLTVDPVTVERANPQRFFAALLAIEPAVIPTRGLTWARLPIKLPSSILLGSRPRRRLRGGHEPD